MDSLLQSPTNIGALLAVLVFIYYLSSLISKNIEVKKRKMAPEAAGAWPVIGHLPLLGGPELPHITLGAMADKYGPAFTIRLGVRRALVVSDWEVAKECFTINDRALATRPSGVAMKHMGYNYAMFAFAPYGPYWREVRKIATLELLSNRRLEMLKHVRVSEVNMSVRELYGLWLKNKNATGADSVKVEMKRWFGDLTLNNVLRMVAGKRYFGATAACGSAEAVRCQTVMRSFFRLVGQFVIADAIPFLGWLDMQGHEKAMKRTAKELDSILEGWMEEHRKMRLSNDEANGEQDFMDVMLSILKDSKLSGYDADTINKATCMNLILGGNDTIKVCLTWALSLLVNNQEVLKRVQDELDRHVGKDRNVEESDMKKLEYLQAVVKEALRLYPPAPLSGPHEAMEECTVAGYHVPVGTRILVNLSKIQRDPRVWSDPLEFRPERFLTSHVGVDVLGQHFELIPFGSGRRACPGTSLGLKVVHLALARLLHAFHLHTPSGAPVDMTESFGLTNLKATPLEVLLLPRLPSHLYQY
ncbi:PREDICTED: cytochrome P450 CYP82D47-like [Nelumbo nucifera]|uniref:Cytochrome P450 CYP82D47-like n=1 Tax=Nelumbo nucifera TaxID=4432 RepID=A0A1U8APC3_NELNU|nr:PREDICTED: cytochrome P450 CYP82D47-like [Nelumbo nucifera]